MDKKELTGYFSIILSGTLLSLELYGLTFIQYIDMQTNGSFYTNAIEYIFILPILLSFLITFAIGIVGLILIIKSKNSNKSSY